MNPGFRRTTAVFGRQATFLLSLLAIVSPLSGCGQREMVQVSGRVQYKGGDPVTGGIRTIRFEPAPDSTAKVRKSASSKIAEDGGFQLFTRKPGDGVYVGKYVVTFTILSSPTGGELLVDPTYVAPDTTPYEIEVTDDVSDLVYEIEPK